jgi:hypothetical protein
MREKVSCFELFQCNPVSLHGWHFSGVFLVFGAQVYAGETGSVYSKVHNNII